MVGPDLSIRLVFGPQKSWDDMNSCSRASVVEWKLVEGALYLGNQESSRSLVPQNPIGDCLSARIDSAATMAARDLLTLAYPIFQLLCPAAN